MDRRNFFGVLTGAVAAGGCIKNIKPNKGKYVAGILKVDKTMLKEIRIWEPDCILQGRAGE